MSVFDRFRQLRRDRAKLAELLQLNAPRMVGLTLEVAEAQRRPVGDWVACLDGTTTPPEIKVIARSVARERFAELKLQALDAAPESGVTYCAAFGLAVEAGVLSHG